MDEKRIAELRTHRGEGMISAVGEYTPDELWEALDTVEKLRALLRRCRPFVEADAQMMADLSRHAPFDQTTQAQHDATEYESERLVRELQDVLGPTLPAVQEEEAK